MEPNQIQTEVPETPRQSALKKLSASLPIANSQVANQQAAARNMQLQQAVQAANPAQATTQNAQQTGAAAAQQAGQEQLQGIQAGQQQQSQVAGSAIQQQGQQLQSKIASLQLGSQQQQLDNIQKLAQLDQQAKREIYDSRMAFSENEMGRQFSNERQLADYAKMHAQNEQDWQNYAQQTSQLDSRKTQMLQTAYAKVSDGIEFQNKQIQQLQANLNKQGLTGEQQKVQQDLLKQKIALQEKLQQAEIGLKKSIASAQSNAANNKAKNEALGQIAGTVIGGAAGAYFSEGDPYATTAGASAGGALGKGAGGMMS